MVAALIAVKGQVAQALKRHEAWVLIARWQRYEHLDLGRDLQPRVCTRVMR